ncbi:hypothetical protein CapIbe_021355 [Capra ibex]
MARGSASGAGSPDQGLTRVPQRYPRLQLIRLPSRCRIFGPSQPNGAAQFSVIVPLEKFCSYVSRIKVKNDKVGRQKVARS